MKIMPIYNLGHGEHQNTPKQKPTLLTNSSCICSRNVEDNVESKTIVSVLQNLEGKTSTESVIYKHILTNFQLCNNDHMTLSYIRIYCSILQQILNMIQGTRFNIIPNLAFKTLEI